MSESYGEAGTGPSRSARLDQVLAELLSQVPEIEAASVVSFDGLPMASALPAGMDEDRVAAMSAALLSLGERAAEGLGRGELSQVYVEGENGTVFLVSADDEAVLVAVASRGAKVGLMLFEVRRAAEALAEVLRADVLPPQRLPDDLLDALTEEPSASPSGPLVGAPDALTEEEPPAGPAGSPVDAPDAVPAEAPVAIPAEAPVAVTPLQMPSRNGWTPDQTGSLPATDWR